MLQIRSLSDPVISAIEKGDRVVVTQKIGENIQNLVDKLKSRGADLEIRFESNKALFSERRKKLSSLVSSDTAVETRCSAEPSRLFHEYMNHQNEVKALITVNSSKDLNRKEGMNGFNIFYQSLIDEGGKIVERLLHANNSAVTSNGVEASKSQLHNQVRNILFDSVEISNFGPFGSGKFTYPLSKRGLVLIRGQCDDGSGSDSNGSGKTSLAMSILWALTGSMDTRLVSDTRAANVAHEGIGEKIRRTAEVVLHGTLNDKPFTVCRRRDNKKSDLRFEIDGKDLTKQSVKDTQSSIDEELGVGDGMIQRASFFGQHSTTLNVSS
jgi:hypothetical protein